MVPTLDAIKGGGGSVGIGATGSISSLMSRELGSVKLSPRSPKSSQRKSPTIKSSQTKSPTIPVSVPCVSRPKRQLRRTAVNEATTSGSSSSSSSHGGSRSTQKTRSSTGKQAQSFPMLGSADIVIDNSPNRKKPEKKGSYIVEVVDLKCGSHEKAWSKPITHQLRKLSFSRLSESIS